MYKFLNKYQLKYIADVHLVNVSKCRVSLFSLADFKPLSPEIEIAYNLSAFLLIKTERESGLFWHF